MGNFPKKHIARVKQYTAKIEAIKAQQKQNPELRRTLENLIVGPKADKQKMKIALKFLKSKGLTYYLLEQYKHRKLPFSLPTMALILFRKLERMKPEELQKFILDARRAKRQFKSLSLKKLEEFKKTRKRLWPERKK